MKFSGISRDRWEEWKPYLDTCLLPVTGLSGDEPPWLATEALERLRDWLELLEKPFQGRIVTYPAYHYANRDATVVRESSAAEQPESRRVGTESGGASRFDGLREVCAALKRGGFRYVIAVSSTVVLAAGEIGADLVVGPDDAADGRLPDALALAEREQRMWRGDEHSPGK